jgi:hypothetical protein
MPTVKQSLVELLKQETVSLLEQFLEHTQDYAQKEFARMENRKSSWDIQQWYDYFDVRFVKMCDVRTREEMCVLDKSEYHRKGYYRMRDAMTRERYIIQDGLDKFIEKELKSARLHYEKSIAKLALRIEKKQLNEDALTITSARIGRNIETTLTDGVKTVKNS